MVFIVALLLRPVPGRDHSVVFATGGAETESPENG
jgi:hypothetical protein